MPEESAAFRDLSFALADAAFHVQRARGLAGALCDRLEATRANEAAVWVAINVAGADAQLARARQFVADLQARRAEIARTCAAMRATLERP
jgi:hypothetical protein